MATKKEALINEQNLVHEVFTHPSGVQIKVIRNKAEGKQFIRGAGFIRSLMKIKETGFDETEDGLKKWASSVKFRPEGIKLNVPIAAGLNECEWSDGEIGFGEEERIELPDGVCIKYNGFTLGSGVAEIEVMEGVSYLNLIHTKVFNVGCLFAVDEFGEMTYKGMSDVNE